VAEYGRISPSEIPIGYLGGILEVDILPYYTTQKSSGMWQNMAKDQLLKYLLGISGAFKNMILYCILLYSAIILTAKIGQNIIFQVIHTLSLPM
jgi:hypothetical protein